MVVNDLGAAVDGTGGDQSPAQEVVNEIVEMGGDAIANFPACEAGVDGSDGASKLVSEDVRE